ncbi:MAG: ATPase domain-containing protein [archaeon]
MAEESKKILVPQGTGPVKITQNGESKEDYIDDGQLGKRYMEGADDKPPGKETKESSLKLSEENESGKEKSFLEKLPSAIIEEEQKTIWAGQKKDYSRVQTGVKGLDELIAGGFERESIVLLVGSTGTGKTVFGMQFLYEGATKFDEPGVLLSFEEEEEAIYHHALNFGWDFRKLSEQNKFKLLVFKPHQITGILEEGGGQIRDTLIELGAKRLVIDSITAYGLLFRDEYKRREKVLEFFNLLRRWGVTSLVICEDFPKDVEREEGSVGFLSDTVVSMYYQQDEEKGIRIHSLEVVKMRGSEHTNKLCALNFEKNGIVVYPEVEVF